VSPCPTAERSGQGVGLLILLVEDEQDRVAPWIFEAGLDCREARTGGPQSICWNPGQESTPVLSNMLLPSADVGNSLSAHCWMRCVAHRGLAD